jgi:hypothetical protein
MGTTQIFLARKEAKFGLVHGFESFDRFFDNDTLKNTKRKLLSSPTKAIVVVVIVVATTVLL